jgi:hypothetical protein
MRRFVVQEHHTADGVHYDLMLEHGRELATWSFPVKPWTKPRQTVKRLKDHRKRYLTYEGEISGNRGSVRIADEGVYELIARTEHLWLVVAVGKRLTGPFVLIEKPNPAKKASSWTFRRL